MERKKREGREWEVDSERRGDDGKEEQNKSGGRRESTGSPLPKSWIRHWTEAMRKSLNMTISLY